MVVNSVTGEIMQSIDYDEYGVVIRNSNPYFQPFGFAGGLVDPITGLVRFGARDYDPYLGRWTAKDPIKFAGGDGNLYVYVDGDPVNRLDITGLAVWLCKRKADLPFPANQFDHHWLKTDTYESGMGAQAGVIPGQGNSDMPFTPTETVDHSGQFWEPGAWCDEIRGVDESCVDEAIRPGQGTGRWLPWNQCQSFVQEVLNTCKE